MSDLDHYHAEQAEKLLAEFSMLTQEQIQKAQIHALLAIVDDLRRIERLLQPVPFRPGMFTRPVSDEDFPA